MLRKFRNGAKHKRRVASFPRTVPHITARNSRGCNARASLPRVRYRTTNDLWGDVKTSPGSGHKASRTRENGSVDDFWETSPANRHSLLDDLRKINKGWGNSTGATSGRLRLMNRDQQCYGMYARSYETLLLSRDVLLTETKSCHETPLVSSFQRPIEPECFPFLSRRQLRL